jgi:hypothetical protein
MSNFMLRIVAAAAIAFGMPLIACAHSQWADGSPVPKWVKTKCCGEQDVHHLLPEQVHRVDGGYLVDGHDGVIPLSQTDPSQDGDYWIFGSTVRSDDGPPKIGDVRCFFIPLSY